MDLKPRRTLRRNQVLMKTGLSRTTQYQLERLSDFPKHFLLTPRCAVWFEDDVDAWLEARQKAQIQVAMAPDHTLRKAFNARSAQLLGSSS